MGSISFAEVEPIDRENKNVDQQELKKIVGNKYWILAGCPIEFYDVANKSDINIDYSQYIEIQELLDNNHYQVKFSMSVGQVDALTLYENIIKGEYIKKEDPNLLEVIKDLDKIGIKKGSYLFLKHPYDEFPGLTKLIVKDIMISPNDSHRKLLVVEFLAEAGYETNLGFYNTDELIERFYIKEPSKMLAKWGQRVVKAIKEKKVLIGMTKEQVIISWGKPRDINRTGGAWGVHEQWIYGDFGPYLYFENDKMTSWQD
jgi:hypothetical protein